MKEFGAALKQAREESGLSLEQIRDRTRINLKHLRAIESGDFPSLPQTYVRAFIREYASVVGLDEEATIAEYNELAEQIKGIPKPPEAIVHSHLMPENDDSVEIVETTAPGAIPKHVEVEGKMEVEEQEFTLPVKRSKYVSDDHKSVELPSSSRKEEEPELPAKDPNQLELPVDEVASVETSDPVETKDSSKANPKEAPPGPPEETKPPAPSKSDNKRPEPPQKIKAPVKPPKKEVPAAAAPPRGTEEHTPPQAKSKEKTKSTTPPKQKQEPKEEEVKHEKQSISDRIKFGKKLEDRPAQKEQKQKPAKQPKKRTPEDEEQRRLLIIGSLITIAIIIGIYGIVYFSEDTTPNTATADSTRTQPNVYAERFIDSTDFIPDEPEILPDTTAGAATPQAGSQQQNENVYASEDSLILEAFSSTPVYFSIRMDTTKTEKGFLSKNEHRVWKAKDRFIISLGDAGAMTFFLNGKQLRSLGGEGLAINNHIINRKTLDQE